MEPTIVWNDPLRTVALQVAVQLYSLLYCVNSCMTVTSVSEHLEAHEFCIAVLARKGSKLKIFLLAHKQNRTWTLIKKT